jgi:hypothetical protein
MIIYVSRIVLAFLIGLISGILSVARAQSPGALDTIADNEGIFIDGQTFKVTSGKMKSDVSLQIRASAARKLDAGVIVFRTNQNLYMVNAPWLFGSGDPNGANDARPNRVRIEYEPPQNPTHQALYETLMERRVLEQTQHMLSPFRFPVELTIKTMGCDGLINSWFSYDDSVPTVHICYELLQDIIRSVPQDTSPLQGVTPHDAVVGPFLFWTLHEVGHAVFHIFEVPLFGREEDAADQFAVYLMLQFDKDQAHRWVEGAVYAAHGFIKELQQSPELQKRMEKFASVHGLPEQRVFNGLCLAYGSDPVLFADVLDSGLLPKTRAGNCEHEYQTFAFAFKSIIRPHIDREMARAVLNTTWFPEPHSR